MNWHKEFPILIIDDEVHDDTGDGRALREVARQFKEKGFQVIEAITGEDGREVFESQPTISAVLLDWELGESTEKKGRGRRLTSADIVTAMRSRNKKVPIFIMTEKHKVQDIHVDVLSQTNGYIWKLEDTPQFIVGKIRDAMKFYLKNLLPPFFKELMTYTEEFKYAWHTPGHMGGVGFLKSAPGKVFFDFFGELTLRSDISVSVPELGSLMEHSGVVGEAEAQASKTFGSEHSYFVTGGTSGANKIVWHGCVSPGDIVLVDRNCHKSIMHAIIMTGAIPLYLIPTRNAQGIIGPIHKDEFKKATIQKKLKSNPITKKMKSPKIRLAVVTNSTYDGLCYHAVSIKNQFKGQVENLHFDEAWYGYAHFHSIYDDRYGMCGRHDDNNHPAIFATQSTHKVLAAFSQGSMVHYKSGKRKVDPDRFNEAFMMHTSTSPQYGIIASLDVATKMMEGEAGRALVEDSLDEAIVFRKKMVDIGKELKTAKNKKRKPWWFKVWQPEISKTKDETLKKNPGAWTLNLGARWHGFAGMEKDYIMLDPIKVTLLTPGIDDRGKMEADGIPANIVTRFLWNRGIVVEKTGFYSFLCLFTIATTKGKSSTLIAELFAFKNLYDQNAPLEEVFPDLVADYPEKYRGKRIQEFCAEMHAFLKKAKITKVTQEVYSKIPEQEMLPAKAYAKLVNDQVEAIPLNKMRNRTAAVMIVPYPPGIPVVMPGEKFTKGTEDILEYLEVYESFDNRFPGFELEIHGIEVRKEAGRKVYYSTFLKK